LPIPRFPVEGLNTSFVLEIPTIVEIPDVTVVNPIKRIALVASSLTTVTPPSFPP